METPDEFVDAAPAGPATLGPSRYIGYRRTGVRTGPHRGLPGTGLTFIISLADPVVTLRSAGSGPVPGPMQALVAGLQRSCTLIEAREIEVGVAIEVEPLAARLLFGMSAAELVDDSVPLAAVLLRGDELVERLAAADGWGRRFSVLDQVLGASLHREVSIDPCLLQVWRRLVSADGPSVAHVADEVGWSRQHVTRRIVAETGVTPRHLRRLARFQRSTTLLASGASHTCVAADAGYFDQPHLIRDWHDLAGCTPRDWMAAEAASGPGRATEDGPVSGREVHHKGEQGPDGCPVPCRYPVDAEPPQLPVRVSAAGQQR